VKQQTTLRGRLSRAFAAGRRELRAAPPPTWRLIDPRAPNERFAGRTVVVTGAAGLVGSVLMDSFLAAGATVHALDRDAIPPPDLGSGYASSSSAERFRGHQLDLADPEAIAAFGRSVERVDILINNVGANDDRRGLEVLDGDSWRSALDINLIGPAVLTGALVSQLRASSVASVVFVTSVNAIAPSPWLHYAAAKAGLAKLTIDLAQDLARDGVRVNAVAPGRIVDAGWPADQRAATPYGLGGGAPPVEAIVHAVQFLADSEVSPMTTGQQLLVTGAPDRGGLLGR
jgi:NAD(P)-dependent dehydrogenase (short-subunit alcohol dehydrogenase family)